MMSMSKAILSFIIDKNANNENNELILLNDSLRTVDNCTRFYKDADAMRHSPEFQSRIEGFLKHNKNFIDGQDLDSVGEFAVSFILNSDNREYLPIMFDDETPIRMRTTSLETTKCEVERARKLLFTSKNKMFLKRMLNDERFEDTTAFNIKLRLPEYKEMSKKGVKPQLIDGEYYMTINDILQYFSTVDKVGPMRSLVEDALEVWKEKMLDLDDELLYYYSRNLRLAINAYDHDKVAKKLVSNLQSSLDNMLDVVKSGSGRIIRYPVSGQYKKYSKTKRIDDNFA